MFDGRQAAVTRRPAAAGWEAFPRALRKWPGLGGQAKLAAMFLFHLAGYAEGLVVITVAELAAELGCTARSARRALGRLAADGLGGEDQDLGGGRLVWHVRDPDEASAARVVGLAGDVQKPLFDDEEAGAVLVPKTPAVLVPKTPPKRGSNHGQAVHDPLQIAIAQVVAKLPDPQGPVEREAVLVPKPPSPSMYIEEEDISLPPSLHRQAQRLHGIHGIHGRTARRHRPWDQLYAAIRGASDSWFPRDEFLASLKEEFEVTLADDRLTHQEVQDRLTAVMRCIVDDEKTDETIFRRMADHVRDGSVPSDSLANLLVDVVGIRRSPKGFTSKSGTAGPFFHVGCKKLVSMAGKTWKE